MSANSRSFAHSELTEALHRHFGFSAFRPGQADALRHILAGRDALVVMPTGSGKSLIYQLAALLLPGTTLVFSPLIALMKDQVDSLVKRNIKATFINSTLDVTEQNRRLAALAGGEYKIVLVAPERLRSTAFREALAQVNLSLFVIDEAHCVSQWGHDFRPDYLHIAEARRDFRPPITLALTATATVRVQKDILDLLGLDRAERRVSGFNRPNLFLQVISASEVKDKLARVRELVTNADGAGIIYAGTRRDTEEVAEFVRQVCGVSAPHYHAGLDAARRARTQDAFMAGDVPLVVATNAFGMGIDRPDVRFVLHYAMPGSLEAYYQEAGRAGRDGLPARAVILYSPHDTALHESFIANDSPSPTQLRAAYEHVHSTPQTSFDTIDRETGLRQVMARVALEQLEAARVITREWQDDVGMMRFHTAALSEPTLRQIAAQVEARQQTKRRLLAKMVAYAETNACRRRTLLDYFGDKDSADATLCCDNDVERVTLQTASETARPAESESEFAALVVLETIANLKFGLGKEKIALILKGSRSQKAAHLTQVPTFGKIAARKTTEIQSLIQQLQDAGYLKQVGADRPMLKLTPRGEHALKTRAAIAVNVSSITPAVQARVKAEREAGGTLQLTEQMLAQGRTPEQIAAERGLTTGTIYSHLAQLIAEGRVNVNAVVAPTLQAQIRAIIEQVGSVQYIAPIKARLPVEVDYNVIRCVVNAWKREHANLAANPSSRNTLNPANLQFRRDDGLPNSSSLAPFGTGSARRGESELPTLPLQRIAQDASGPVLFEKLRAWRLAQARVEAVPAFVIFDDATLHALAALRPRSLDELKQVGGIRGHKAERFGGEVLKLIAEHVANEPMRAASGSQTDTPATNVQAESSTLAPAFSRVPAPSETTPPDAIAAFLGRPHPRPLKGPWRAGWALDFHSRFDGDNQQRGLIGELIYRLKYRGEQEVATELAAQWVALLRQHPELPAPDAVIAIPPTTVREFEPVGILALALAEQLNVLMLSGVLVKTRATRPQKEMTSLAQKQANVSGVFRVNGDVRGKQLILVDDLYDSGATLSEAARLLTRGGAAGIVVLACTKTIHSDA